MSMLKLDVSLHRLKKIRYERTLLLLCGATTAGTLGSMASGEKLRITRLPRAFRSSSAHHQWVKRELPTDSLVELIDIYPTLCDLANIPQPDHLAGKSLVPVLHNPNAIIKGVAMSQFPTPALREWAANPLSPEMRETFFGPLISQVEQKIKRTTR